MLVNKACPSCHSGRMTVFYELTGVPIHSVLLLATRDEALSFPRGDIALAFCDVCGFIANIAFNPGVLEYSTRYEATQGFSPTFSAYHRELATRLVEQYGLRNKNIIEIGCGQGEFINLLCELGHNRGVGFDPAYDHGRDRSEVKAGVTFVKDFYSEQYAHYGADFVCCKMTLEHIQDTVGFVSMVRQSLRDQPGTVVFFQVPDVKRILRELAFWDIYYEHCSYFSLGSLARLFRRCGFDIIDLARDYAGQYLTISARPDDGMGTPSDQENDLSDLSGEVTYFANNCQRKLAQWRQDMERVVSGQRRAVVWGASSKAVSFLTTLNVRNEIEYAVDINPRKHGTYIAGTGQKIVSPEFLCEYRPDVVIVMNPIYCREIERSLSSLDVMAELVVV